MTPNDNFETQEEVQITEVVVEQTPETQPAAAPSVAPVSTVTTVKRDRKVSAGMFGIPEIAALAVSGLILLGVLGFYFLVAAPTQRELKTAKVKRDELDIKLNSTRTKFEGFTSDQDFAAKLVRSVDEFESAHLPIASMGRTELYNRLNGLLAAYSLRNTSGPEYSPLEIKILKDNQPQQERGRAKFESLFPGDYINMTVEGSYVNLRRFMREIEATRQFVVISTVELEAAEDKPQEVDPSRPPQVGPPVTAPRGKTHGNNVSLHMEFAAYYRRAGMPVAVPAPTGTSEVK